MAWRFDAVVAGALGGSTALVPQTSSKEVSMGHFRSEVRRPAMHAVGGRRSAMRYKAMMALLALVFGILSLLVGCATTHPSLAGSGLTRLRAVEVEFPSHIQLDPEGETTPNGHPKSLVEFALRLSSEGRHARAAGFFVEASQAPSSDNEFAVACLCAAANEYFRAGALEPWKRTVGALRERMNRFQLASVDGLAEMHMVLCDVAEGRELDSATALPNELRALLRSSR